MTRFSLRHARLAVGLGVPLLGACTLSLNPAYEDTGEPTSTGGESTTTGPPVSPCPDDQPLGAWYPDDDADGHGDREAAAQEACEAPKGHVDNNGDCNDDIPEIHPGVKEQCNGYDENCNGVVDDGAPDCSPCRIELTKSHVYWLCPDDGITWDEAVDRCVKRSGGTTAVRIASVHDAAESDLLIELVRANIKADKSGEQHAWIGLARRDDPQATCDPPDPVLDWEWRDGSPVDFTPPWNVGEPNNMNSSCSCADDPGCFENCVEIKIRVSDQKAGWNDALCDVKNAAGYICKTKRDPVLFPGG